MFRKGRGESQFSERTCRPQSRQQGLGALCSYALAQRAGPSLAELGSGSHLDLSLLFAGSRLPGQLLSRHHPDVILLCRFLKHFFLVLSFLRELPRDLGLTGLASFFRSSWSVLNLLRGKTLLLRRGGGLPATHSFGQRPRIRQKPGLRHASLVPAPRTRRGHGEEEAGAWQPTYRVHWQRKRCPVSPSRLATLSELKS